MYLVFDIGGTNIRAASATSFSLESLSETIVVPTPKDYTEGLGEILRISKELSVGEGIEALALGVPGPLAPERLTLERAPNLKDWEGKQIVSALETELRTKVYLENDSSLLALGEATHGAGRGHDIMGFIAVGTGVGGSRVVNGRIDTNSLGFEPGHQLIELNGQYVSIEKMIAGAGVSERTGIPAQEVNDPTIWDESANYLALCVYNSIVHWSPSIMVLGGGLINSDTIKLHKVEEKLKNLPSVFSKLPEIVKGTLGDRAGLVGGLTLISQTLS